MTQSFKVELLHGLLEAGRRHTLAELRDPTGHDEAMLAELRRDATPAECVSALDRRAHAAHRRDRVAPRWIASDN